MTTSNFSALIFSFLFISNLASAKEQMTCQAGSGKSTKLAEAFEKGLESPTDPVMIDYLEYKNRTPAADLGKAECATAQGLQQLKEQAQDIAAHVALPQLTPQCVAASLNMAYVGRSSWGCSGPDDTNPPVAGKGNRQCFTPDMVNYITWLTNSAMSCVSDPDNPIDPRLIFLKYHRESQMNYAMAYSGGRGLGQLTSDPIVEMTRTAQPGNRFLNSLRLSEKKECGPFQSILDDAPIPKGQKFVVGANNQCRWLSPGEGAARNLVNSLTFYRFLRESFAGDAAVSARNRLKALAAEDPSYESADFLNYMAIALYGPEGQAPAGDVENALNASTAGKDTNEKLSLFINSLKKNVPYIRQIFNSGRELSSRVDDNTNQANLLSDCFDLAQ